ncbi:uncharacterized protein LOC103042579 [Astyanax mexicanus]|uniref:uncharacterized protein LOC103042579 n=1 Tax=Astyanax mexicanus TaxID=7994 RepID=UPI0020CB3AFE|nr:uncharacterized protein LOC103042579 [Astyanax mexicanus]
MGKITVKQERKKRATSAQSLYDRPEVTCVPAEEKENTEVRVVQHQSVGGNLTPHSPATLNSNLSAFGESLICAPAFCNNKVGRDVNLFFLKDNVPVTQRPECGVIENKAVVQEVPSDSDTVSKTILRTPKKLKKNSHTIFRRKRGKCTRRTRLAFDDVKDLPDLLSIEERKDMIIDIVTPSEGHKLTSVTGEITGARVTADYNCYECGAAIRHFKAKAFRVKCTKCQNSWKCAKVQCTCRAEITIELSRDEKQTVVLNDSLLRSIMSYNTEGYCNTDKLEKRILKMEILQVDFEDGEPKRVQKIASELGLGTA